MKISIDVFDKKSIQKAIKQLQKYRRTLIDKVNIFVERVGQLGIEIVKANISHYNIPYNFEPKLENGNLLKMGNSICIILDDENALFWEIGTGALGEDNPYPISIWQYDIKNKGYAGWYYPVEYGSDGDYSFLAKNGDYYWTQGIPSHKFFYNSYDTLLNSSWGQIIQIAREVFGDAELD